MTPGNGMGAVRLPARLFDWQSGPEMGALPESFRAQLQAVFADWQARLVCLLPGAAGGRNVGHRRRRATGGVFLIGWKARCCALLAQSAEPLTVFVWFFWPDCRAEFLPQMTVSLNTREKPCSRQCQIEKTTPGYRASVQMLTMPPCPRAMSACASAIPRSTTKTRWPSPAKARWCANFPWCPVLIWVGVVAVSQHPDYQPGDAASC